MAPSVRKYARVAGLTYIVIMVLGVLKSVVDSQLIMPGDDAATVMNILANETVFRAGLLSDVVLYSLVILLSLALYQILQSVSTYLALTALCFRVAEGIVGIVVVMLSGLVPLALLGGHIGTDSAGLHALVGRFLELRSTGLNVVLMLIGIGGTIYAYLFLVSRYVPRVLAVWGIVTYASMLCLGALGILYPSHPPIITTVLFTSGGLFEVLFGFWLLIKGVDADRGGAS